MLKNSNYRRSVTAALLIMSFALSNCLAAENTLKEVPSKSAVESKSESKLKAENAESIKYLAQVIEKFNKMGVGVSAFEKSLSKAKVLSEEGRENEAQDCLQHLRRCLEEQQQSYYSNKIQNWHRERQRYIADRKARLKLAGKQGSPENAAAQSGGLGKAAHNTIARAKGEYKPFIYPIAR
ncbi:MAG: hypothetical protein K2X27_25930 [Candidatus Obscuribacterales bacterium]|nr:hypothetical protein [Candidatus Obscuribacterales bacterium]